MKSVKRKFSGNVSASVKTSSRASGGGAKHLTLPKDTAMLLFDDKVSKVKLDFMVYEVKDINKHPLDKNNIGPEQLWWRRHYLLHRNIGADNTSYICPKTIGKRCPICEAQKELFQTDKKAAVKLYAQSRFLHAVIPIGSAKHDEKPYIWDMSEKMFNDCLNTELDSNDEDFSGFPGPEGMTLVCKLKWDTIGDGKPFPEVVSIDFKEREAYEDSIIDETPNLDDLLVILSYDELEAVFLGIDDVSQAPAKVEEEEEEEAPRQRKTGKTETKKPAKVEEEEEEETPKRKKVVEEEPARKRKVAQPEPEEEEEEEAPPAKTKKPVKSVLLWKDFVNNSYKQCRLTVKQYDLDIDPADYDEDTAADFVIAICKALSIEIPKVTKGVVEAQAKHERTRKPAPVADEEEEEDATITWDELQGMSESKLLRYCSTNKLKLDTDVYDDDVVALRKAIAKELHVIVPVAKATKGTTKTEAASAVGSKNLCPFKHRFGVDTDKKDECDRCDVWGACVSEKEAK